MRQRANLLGQCAWWLKADAPANARCVRQDQKQREVRAQASCPVGPSCPEEGQDLVHLRHLGPTDEPCTHHQPGHTKPVLSSGLHPHALLGGWDVTTRYPGADNFTLKYEQDGLGRLEKITQSGGAIPWVQPLEFGWAGALYTGRKQAFDPMLGSPNPMKESRSFDGLGRLRRLEYRAVELDPTQGVPESPQWANLYCLGSWQAECASALWSSDFKYDVMGRIASVDQKARHPLWHDSSQSQLRPEAQRRHDWRGYGYNARSFLTKEYRSDTSQTVAHQGLTNHEVTQAQLESIIGSSATPGMRWDWSRDEQSGDLKSIAQAGLPANTTWEHINPAASNHRSSGHELVSVSLDGVAAAPITHDARGRITSDTRHDYAWDALDRLVASKPKGAPVWEEVHHYDAQGRLLLTERNGITERFVYDGLHKVALYDGQGDLQWRAVWGAGLDELVWWHDAAGGHSYIPVTDGMKSVVGLWNEQTAKMDQVRSFDPRGQATTWSPQEVALLPGARRLHLPWHQLRPVRVRAAPLPTFRRPKPHPLRLWLALRLAQSHHRAGADAPALVLPQAWPVCQAMTRWSTLDSFNLFAFAGRDPVNSWDPMGLSNESFSDFWDGVEKGLKEEHSNQVKEMSKSFDSAVETAKEVKDNWKYMLEPEIWKGTAREAGAMVDDMAKQTMQEGRQCAANASKCLAESALAKEAKALAEDLERGDMKALGERTGKLTGRGISEWAKGSVTKGTGKFVRVGKGGKVGNTGKGGGKKGGKGKGDGNERCKGNKCSRKGECFVAGTLIQGLSQRPIEQVIPGWLVDFAGDYAYVVFTPSPTEQEWHHISADVSIQVVGGRIRSVMFPTKGLSQARESQYQELVGSRYVVGDVHATDITPLLWRSLDARLNRTDGSVAALSLIRPLWWIERTGAREGKQVEMEAKEAGISGSAEILNVRDDVHLDSRTLDSGLAPVISTITHQKARVIDLVLNGDDSSVLGVTPPHPLYSADRDQWVAAGKFRIGERIKTRGGIEAMVTAIRDEGRQETVFNLEVHRAKSYHVGMQELLAHNSDVDDCEYFTSIKNSSKYPSDFEAERGGMTKNKINDDKWKERLNLKEPKGNWKKIYKDGWSDNERVSIHYFESKSGTVVDVKVKKGWSNSQK